MKKILIFGGSGFIGKYLSNYFSNNYKVYVFSRSLHYPKGNIEYVIWNENTPNDELREIVNGAYTVINLVGENINTIFTEEKKRLIISSRVNSVKRIYELISSVEIPPEYWLQASAIGYYGNSFSEIYDENSEKGKGFLADVCDLWEKEFRKIELQITKKAIIRIGNVLGNDGGMFPPLKFITRLFLGGSSGNGKHFVSWIHITDLVRIFDFLISEKKEGVFNAVSPNFVSNKEFMSALRKAMNRPFSPPVPKLLLKYMSYLIGTDFELIFASSKVYPKNLIDNGFMFNFPNLQESLHNLIKKV